MSALSREVISNHIGSWSSTLYFLVFHFSCHNRNDSRLSPVDENQCKGNQECKHHNTAGHVKGIDVVSCLVWDHSCGDQRKTKDRKISTKRYETKLEMLVSWINDSCKSLSRTELS